MFKVAQEALQHNFVLIPLAKSKFTHTKAKHLAKSFPLTRECSVCHCLVLLGHPGPIELAGDLARLHLATQAILACTRSTTCVLTMPTYLVSHDTVKKKCRYS